MRLALALLVSTLAAGGTAAQTAPSLLYSVEPTQGQSGDSFGRAIASVPDADGDGAPDLLIGQTVLSGGARRPGRAYLAAGATGAILRTLEPPPGLESSGFGSGVGPAGDVDGDGVDDFAVGAPEIYTGSYSTRPGYVHLYSGATGERLHSWPAAEQSPDPEPGDAFGATVTLVGDMDGDGVRELAVGAPQRFCGDRRPRVDIFDVRTGARRLVLVPPTTACASRFGDSMVALSDFDGDGVREIAVGAPEEYAPQRHAGRVYVFDGATGTLLHSIDLPVSQKYAYFGEALVLTHDVDGNGERDLYVGAPGYDVAAVPDDFTGRVFLVSSATGAHLRSVDPPAPSPDGFFGQSLAADRDLDGDGVEDIAAGVLTPNNLGAVYAISGATGGVLWELRPPNPEPPVRFGSSAIVVRDFDGDDLVDVAISADAEDTPFGRGRVHVFGGPRTIPTAPGPAVGGIGLDVSSPAYRRAPLAVHLPSPDEVRLTVHDALGREVARVIDGALGSGRHALSLNVAGWAPGVYVVRLAADGRVVARPLVVVR